MSARKPTVMQWLEWVLSDALMVDYCEERSKRAWQKGQSLDGAAFYRAARQYGRDADGGWDCLQRAPVEAA